MIVGAEPAASGRFGSGLAGRARVDRPPDPLRGERHVDVTDAELLERVHDGVDERRPLLVPRILATWRGPAENPNAR